ncbi:hypothetical protein [Propionibacterium cyclohexanicum]|uniref:baeRF11 domain-containing protein n=1 Tax=Propionibacterium cyclohexanicum TaxID=64702 RepID=UPI000B838E2B|nr:hypothetical protein [Propionibacterium cyclohexanicum]
MIRYELPSTGDLIKLGESHPNAITIYLPTAPTPTGRQQAVTAAKSAVDEAVRTLRGQGMNRAEQEAIRVRWEEILVDTRLWGNLSNSLVILLAPDFSEDFVLPNHLEAQTQIGDHFDLGQLVRAVTSPQAAFALTISSNGWNLWRASASQRATELELGEEYAEDAADATNRMTIRGRKLLRRLSGDEGKKVLIERYAQVVADAVRTELGKLDPHATLPLFVFATEPLLSMIQSENLPWQLVAVPGAPDVLRPDEIDGAVRQRIGALSAQANSELADSIGHGFTSGLALTDLAPIARAAVAGAVSTFIYDFTAQVRGTLDDATGAIVLAQDGVDLLSRIAVIVLQNGGEVIAVRPGEIKAEIWHGQVLAGLRHPIA